VNRVIKLFLAFAFEYTIRVDTTTHEEIVVFA